jgi:hypothetical protein
VHDWPCGDHFIQLNQLSNSLDHDMANQLATNGALLFGFSAGFDRNQDFHSPLRWVAGQTT